MKRIIPIIVFILLLAFASCTQPNEEPQELLTVTFFDDSGFVTTRVVNKGQSLGSNYPAVSPVTNFTFKGWNTRADGTGQYITEKTPINENMNLHAIWEYDGYIVYFFVTGPYGSRIVRNDYKVLSNPYYTMDTSLSFFVFYGSTSGMYYKVKSVSAEGASLQCVYSNGILDYLYLSNFTSKHIFVDLDFLE